LVAVSFPLIEYTVNARGYGMVVVLFLAMLLLGKHIKRRPSWLGWASVSGLSALGFWTIPTFFYPMGIVALWLLLSIWFEHYGQQRRRMLRQFAISMIAGGALTLVAYVPVLVVSGLDSLIANRYVVSPNPLTAQYAVADIPQMFVSYFNTAVPQGLYELMFLGVLTSIVVHTRLSRDQVPLLIPAVLWLTFVIIAQDIVPYYRVWTYLIPIYFITAVAGCLYWIGQLVGRRPSLRYVPLTSAVALTLLVGARVVEARFVPNSYETGYTPDAEQVAKYVNQLLPPGSVVISNEVDSFQFQYYSRYYFPESQVRFPNPYGDQSLFTDEDLYAGRVFLASYAPEESRTLHREIAYLGERYSQYDLVVEHRFQFISLFKLLPVQADEICIDADFTHDWNDWRAEGEPVMFGEENGERWVEFGGGSDIVLLESPRALVWRDFILTGRLMFRQSHADFNELSLDFGIQDEMRTDNLTFDTNFDRVLTTTGDATGESQSFVTPHALEDNRWYTLRVSIMGERLDVFIDDARIATAPVDVGRLPMLRWRSAPGVRIALDDVKVTCKFAPGLTTADTAPLDPG
jgi:hypothetical protein